MYARVYQLTTPGDAATLDNDMHISVPTTYRVHTVFISVCLLHTVCIPCAYQCAYYILCAGILCVGLRKEGTQTYPRLSTREEG